MGLEQTVRFAAGVPSWDAVRAYLARVGEPGTLRMIDGLPAFPDETPEPGWRELRVAAGGAMVTVRRTADALACVVWGNADAALLAARDRFLWACAAAGGGVVDAEPYSLTADEFAVAVDICPA